MSSSRPRNTRRRRYARDAVAAIEGIYARGRWPILVGGTGLYYRALVRGLFPGPGADAQMRARLEAIAARRGVEFLHRMVAARRSAVGRADSSARSQADGARARSVFPDGEAADRSFRSNGVAAARL